MNAPHTFPVRRPPLSLTPKQIARFHGSYLAGGPGDCWPWQGELKRDGYGLFSVHPRVYLAHRMSYELATGEHPGAFNVCHRCDNPPCVNPSHLWLGTQQDNARDATEKGRNVGMFRRGLPNPMVTLSLSEVKEIRRRYERGERSGRLAAEYGVSQATVWRVGTKRTWTHV